MRLNEKGDALTLAMAAAVFVGVSVMVMTTVMSNLGSKGRRARVQNEMDSTTLAINQLLNNRDICASALRLKTGVIVNFPATVPPNTAFNEILNFPIEGIWIAGAATNFIYCAELSPTICAQSPVAPIKEIRFVLNNNSINNTVGNYLGDTSGNYRLLSGNIRLQFGGNTLGGVFAPRVFPVQVLVDSRIGNAIVACYGRESMSNLCSAMGGYINPADGSCTNMMGLCGTRPQDTPAQCPAPPSAAPTACPNPPLHWQDVWFAKGIDPSLQMVCECQKVCTSP